MKGTDSTNPDKLVHKLYTNNTTYDDEWVFSNDLRLAHPNAQNKTCWCWAASAKMVGEHNGGSGALSIDPVIPTYSSNFHSYDLHYYYGETQNHSYTVDGGQREILVDVFGDDDNHSGSIYNIEQALQLASFNTMNIGTLFMFTNVTSNIPAMNNELTAGRWVCGSTLPNDASVGHEIVIRKYNTVTEEYTFWDPWDNKEGTFTRLDLLCNKIKLNDSVERQLLFVQYCN